MAGGKNNPSDRPTAPISSEERKETIIGNEDERRDLLRVS